MHHRSWRGALVLALSLALFVLHAMPLREWLIDDAGISLAYARNLALGFGLRAQPGAPPIEGFSNPLWTLLLAAFAAAGLLDVLLTPKLLSLGLVVAAFALIVGQAQGRAESPAWPRALPVLLLPLNASFVIWATSGLENALLVLLVVVSALLSLRALEGRSGPGQDAASGVVSGLLALTRPDAVVYAVGYPLALLGRSASKREWPALPGRGLRYGAGLVPVLGSYLAFRLGYYGDWAPNTYHAKDKPALSSLLDLGKLADLGASLAGPWSGPLLLVLALGVAGLVVRRRFEARLQVLGLYLALATAVYLLLPVDWMGEYRFATSFFVFFYWFAGETLAALLRTEPVGGPRSLPRLAVSGVALALVAATAVVHAERARAFAEGPVVPFARVAAFSGHGYNRLAAILGRTDASLLTPDLGGTLFYSSLRVFDLVGLCDPVIARTLRSDRRAFLDYVFERARPTFIHAHASWAEWADFGADPRFHRDYVPVSVTWPAPEGASGHRPDVPWTADYVRRDAVEDEPAKLERLRAAFRELGLPALSP